MKSRILCGLSTVVALSAIAQPLATTSNNQTLTYLEYLKTEAIQPTHSDVRATFEQHSADPIPQQLLLNELQTNTNHRITINIDKNHQQECYEYQGKLQHCVIKPVMSPQPAAKINNQALRSNLMAMEAPQAEDERDKINDLVIPDAVLKACIVQQASFNNFIYADELVALNCYENALQDLSGISRLKNLTHLNLGGNASTPSVLRNVEQLTQLPNLGNLHLFGFYIPSINWLTNFPQLNSLSFHYIQTDSDLAVLKELDQITNFSYSTDKNIANTLIASLVNDMANLQYLFVNTNTPDALTGIAHNKISEVTIFDVKDVNFVRNLPALNSLHIHNKLYNNKLQEIDLNALSQRENLSNLTLSATVLDVHDISVISSLKNLNSLSLQKTNQIENLAFFKDLPKLGILLLDNFVNDTNFASFSLPDNLHQLALTRSSGFGQSSPSLKTITSLIENPKKLQTLTLRGQEYLPCNEISQITSKIATVYAPEKCGQTATRLEDVNIPDAALKQCIINQGLDYLEDITNLNCYYVKDITGLAYLKNLIWLNLTGDTNTQVLGGDLKAIEQLDKLVSLKLQSQKLLDHQIAIKYPASLTSLDLSYNQLTQFAVNYLKNVLPQLTTLNLNNNKFTSFGWLATASDLTQINIGDNSVSDLSFITHLSKLKSLGIAGMQQKSLTSFTMPAELNYLDVSRNDFNSIKIVTDRLQNPGLLTTLIANEMQLTELSGFTALPNLRTLSLIGNKGALSYNGISSLKALNYLNVQQAVLPTKFPDFIIPSQLEYLYMSQWVDKEATVTDISAIVEAAAQFKSVNLSGQITIQCSQINNLRQHANAASFTFPISCGAFVITPITVPDPVLRACLLNRTISSVLNCNGNIKDWTGIANFPILNNIIVNGTETSAIAVRGLDELKYLFNLRFLSLIGQGINDDALAELKHDNLPTLNLSRNPITQNGLLKIATTVKNVSGVVLQQTQISSLDFIEQVNFFLLDLRYNPLIKSFAPLSKLASGTKSIRLSADDRNYLIGLKFPAHLEHVTLEGSAFNSLSDMMSLFSNPSRLISLTLSSNLASLTGLELASNLKSLTLYNQQNSLLTDFSPINKLLMLENLAISHSNLTSLTSLKPLLPQLKYLSITNSPVKDLSDLAALTSARSLEISNLTATDYSPLHLLTNLQYLNVYSNKAISCDEISKLRLKLPKAQVFYHDLCLNISTNTVAPSNGKAITTVSYYDPSQVTLGELSIINGQINFKPAHNVSGWVELKLRYTTSDTTTNTTLQVWVEPKATKPRKGLPWWILTAAQSATPEKMTDAMVGNWHFGCDGSGRSLIYEILKAGPNRIHFSRSVTRDYANNNCTGSFKDTSDTHDTIQDFSNIVGVTALAAGEVKISARGVLEDGATPVNTTIIMSANRNSLKVEGDDSWNFIRRAPSFAFPQ